MLLVQQYRMLDHGKLRGIASLCDGFDCFVFAWSLYVVFVNQ